jgi:uncharacterized protein involved in outer membrane biogenesis
MKAHRPILIAAILLIGAAVLAPYFISLDDYIPQLEKEASAKLQEPVTVTAIRFSPLPIPHLTIEGCSVGKNTQIRLGTIRVTPALFSLLGSSRVIKSIEIDSLILTQAALGKISAWSNSAADRPAQQPPPIRIESLRFNNAAIEFGNARFGPFDAQVSLDSHGELEEAKLSTVDAKLKLAIKRDQPNYVIDFKATEWTLPIGTPLRFDELILQGRATLSDANFSEIRAKLYGGTASGTTHLSWAKGWQLNGKFDIDHVDLENIVSMLSAGLHVGGKVSAKPVFSASAPSAEHLVNALRLETPFNIQNGLIHGVDIQKAATSLIKQKTSGGETRFDQLSGHLLMDAGGHHLTQLKIASGALAADGNVLVSPKKELSGRINAQVSLMGASTSVPLNVSGTIGSPFLYPTGGTVAGAAVGTAVLGPGIGTSVGAKVGGWAEGLFGDKDEKKPKPKP